MKKIFLGLSILFLAAACAQSRPVAVNPKIVPSIPTPTPASALSQVKISGKIGGCVPKDVPPGSITTMECEIGLQADDGSYYHLKNLLGKDVIAPNGTEVIVVGNFSAAPSKYVNVKGSIDVSQVLPSSGELTAEQALHLISVLPEVRAYVNRVKQAGGDPHVAASDQLGDLGTPNPYWEVHVYENLGDHNATFAWYNVYQKTGKIEKQ